MATITKRVGVKGTTYNAKVRIKGHPPASESFDKRGDAMRWASSTEAAMREGRRFSGSESERHTVAELIDRYGRDLMPGKGASAQDDQARQLAWWRAELGHAALSTWGREVEGARLPAGAGADVAAGPLVP